MEQIKINGVIDDVAKIHEVNDRIKTVGGLRIETQQENSKGEITTLRTMLSMVQWGAGADLLQFVAGDKVTVTGTVGWKTTIIEGEQRLLTTILVTEITEGWE